MLSFNAVHKGYLQMSQSVKCRRGELVGVVHMSRGTNCRVTQGYPYTVLWKRNLWQIWKIAARLLGKERRFTEKSFSVPKKECIPKSRFERGEERKSPAMQSRKHWPSNMARCVFEREQERTALTSPGTQSMPQKDGKAAMAKLECTASGTPSTAVGITAQLDQSAFWKLHEKEGMGISHP